jgi:hypothetical protein
MLRAVPGSGARKPGATSPRTNVSVICTKVDSGISTTLVTLPPGAFTICSEPDTVASASSLAARFTSTSAVAATVTSALSSELPAR